MRTIHFNKRAVLISVLIGSGVILLTVNQVVTFSSHSSASANVARDAVARRKAENVDKAVPINAPKEETKEEEGDVIEEPRKRPETDDHLAAESNAENEQAENEKPKAEEQNKANVAEPPKLEPKDIQNAERREFVKRMISHAWWGYRNHTWGANEIKPLSLQSHSQPIFGGDKMAATIIDGADTLYIVGLKEEYKQAADFIKANFTMENANQVSTFETTIRFLGGFLSLYALTHDTMYLDKATDVADALMPAFATKTGIAKSIVNTKTKKASNYGWVIGSSSILAEFGSLHLEFLYLSELVGNPLYRQKVEKIRDVLEKAEKTDGLYPNYMNPENGEFVGNHVSLGALGDSFYEYLIKSYVHTAHKDVQAYKMYKAVSAAIRKKMIFTSPGGLKYVAELRNGVPEHKMSHLSCFCPGMFALEADVETDPKEKETVMQLAEDLGHTCHESYARSPSGIGPEMFYFKENEEAMSKRGENGYVLRPEAMEGWFYLWRLTKKEKYREWIWDAIKAIEKYCRKDNGYVGLQNVYKPDQGPDDVQQSFLIAETLKYAYLTFADDNLPLSKWVFNTEAHPFPIGFENMQKDSKTL